MISLPLVGVITFALNIPFLKKQYLKMPLFSIQFWERLM